jgi:hypothetical protein
MFDGGISWHHGRSDYLLVHTIYFCVNYLDDTSGWVYSPARGIEPKNLDTQQARLSLLRPPQGPSTTGGRSTAGLRSPVLLPNSKKLLKAALCRDCGAIRGATREKRRRCKRAKSAAPEKAELGVGWGGRTRTSTIRINSAVSYRLDHAPSAKLPYCIQAGYFVHGGTGQKVLSVSCCAPQPPAKRMSRVCRRVVALTLLSRGCYRDCLHWPHCNPPYGGRV